MKSRFFKLILTLILIFSLAGCNMSLRANEPYQSPTPYEELRIQMIETVEPSVVVVKTETGHGSGIIYRSEPVPSSTLTRYYVMTNYHVVEDGGEMTIHFGDDALDIPVKDFAGHEPYDIAVVRFETDRVLRVHQVPGLSNPADALVNQEIIKGQDVYAIGTPQDINKFNYVTQGIVSLPEFDYNGIPGLALMHDAELNPGNSGGPLFNLNGDLIGINVAKVSSVSSQDGTIAAEGLNYSLSINKINQTVKNFTQFQSVERKPRLGISVQEVPVFLETNDASLIPPDAVGVVVVGFDMTRNAKDVLELYDLIIEMNGSAVTSIADIAAQLEGAEFGDSHTLKVMRKVGTEFVEFTVTIILS